MIRKLLTLVAVATLIGAGAPASAQSEQEPPLCNFCEPCGLRGIRTLDLAATPWAIMYLSQPTCWEGWTCDDALDCDMSARAELNALIEKPSFAQPKAFERKYPGSLETVADRGVVLVKDACSKQIAAVLSIPKRQMIALGKFLETQSATALLAEL